MKTYWGLSKFELFFAVLGVLGVMYFILTSIYSNIELKNNKRYAAGKVIGISTTGNGSWYQYEFYVHKVRYEGERSEDGRVKVEIGDRFWVIYARNNPYNNQMIFHRSDDPY